LPSKVPNRLGRMRRPRTQNSKSRNGAAPAYAKLQIEEQRGCRKAGDSANPGTPRCLHDACIVLTQALTRKQNAALSDGTFGSATAIPLPGFEPGFPD
jgi:hypothetical protein